MNFHDVNYLYLGIWIFVLFMYLLSASLDKLSDYSYNNEYIKLGIFDKLFTYQRDLGKGILLRTFIIQLLIILYFFLGVILIVLSLYKTPEFALQCIRLYFFITICSILGLYMYQKKF